MVWPIQPIEGMSVLEDASIYVELEVKRNVEVQSEMLETMTSLKVDLDILKADNAKLMNARSKPEEINEIILKSLSHKAPHKNNSQNSCSVEKGKK